MSDHLIICLHGMGSHDEGWEQDAIIKPLKEAYNQYDELTSIQSFDDKFEFYPINYNEIFEQYIERKRDVLSQLGNLTEAAENALAGLGGTAAKLMQLYKATDIDDDSFWSTHLGDVFLYLVNDNIRSEINAYVHAQLSEIMTTYTQKYEGVNHISIIAHSLGTAVMMEALQQIYTDDTNFRDVYGKFKVIMTVANVANLTTTITGGKIYESEAHPAADSNKGVCSHYINTWHDLDIFTMHKRFRPNQQSWDRFEPNQSMSGHIYLEVPIGARDLQRKNAHDVEHYLSHPNVHLAFFRYLEAGAHFGGVVSKEDRRKKLIKWRENTLWGQIKARINQSANVLSDDFEEIKDALEDAKNSSVETMLEDIKVLSERIKAIPDSTNDEIRSLKQDIVKIVDEFWERG